MKRPLLRNLLLSRRTGLGLACLCLASLLGPFLTQQGFGSPLELQAQSSSHRSTHLFDRLVASQGKVGRIGRRLSMWVENLNVAGTSSEAALRFVRVTEDVFVRPQSKTQPERFAVRVLGIESEALGDQQRAMRKAQLQAIEGFAHHYGGFQIRNLEQAKKNYRVLSHPQPVLRLGRALFVYDVLPNQQGKSSYRLLVDSKLNTVVDEMELAPNGVLVRARFYLTLQLGKQLTYPKNVDWWKPWNQVVDHSNLKAAEQASGFKAQLPKSGVEGYRIFSHRSARHSVSGQHYLILGFTDGIDYRFLLESKMNPSSFEAQTGLVANEAHQRVFYCQLGPAPQYFTYVKGKALILVGHFYPTTTENGTQPSIPKLPDMLRSLLQP